MRAAHTHTHILYGRSLTSMAYKSKHAQQYALLMHMIRFVRLNAYMNYEFFAEREKAKGKNAYTHTMGFFLTVEYAA